MIPTLSSMVPGINNSYAPPSIFGSNPTSWGPLLSVFLNLFIGVSFSIALLGVGYAFFMYMFSGGDPKSIKKAWATFLWSLIAGLVSLGSVAIKNVIFQTYGVTDTNITSEVLFN